MRKRTIFGALIATLGLFLCGCQQPSLIAAQASRDYEAALQADVRGEKQSAFESYLKAARGGHTNAQFEAGWRYATGNGVVRNDSLALEWYLKAAEQGHGTANNNIGAMFFNGRIGASNRARALAWYLRASAFASGIAMDNIAAYYRNGYLVGRDAAKEYFWEALAVRFGHSPANERMVKAGAALSEDRRRSIDEAVRTYRIENLQIVAADLLAVSDIEDFDAADRTTWMPAVTPIRFRFPTNTAQLANEGSAG